MPRTCCAASARLTQRDGVRCARSGAVLYSSVLYWNATRLMAQMATAVGDEALAATMAAEAEKVQRAVTARLWNEQLGVFRASTGLESENIDVWGNAMAGAMGFTTAAQDASMFRYFAANEKNIFYEGQVREVPFPTQWTDRSSTSCTRTNSCPLHPSDPVATVRTYQNGVSRVPLSHASHLPPSAVACC